jgi:hypothetical protein
VPRTVRPQSRGTSRLPKSPAAVVFPGLFAENSVFPVARTPLRRGGETATWKTRYSYLFVRKISYVIGENLDSSSGFATTKRGFLSALTV